MNSVDQLAEAILAHCYSDFRNRGLAASALADGYEGPTFPSLREEFGQDPVNFDLAIESLESEDYLETGPTAAYDNDWSSGVIVLGVYSKREYVHLTEKGYRKAQYGAEKPGPVGQPQVHISGSTFVQSPVGVGNTVSQSLTLNFDRTEEVVAYLVELAQSNGENADEAKPLARELVGAANCGDMARGRSLFQKLFGAASDAVRQIAWGVVSALIAKQMGI